MQVSEAVLAEPDAEVRAAQLTELLNGTQEWITYFSEHRDRALLEMREGGASYEDVARALGVSKSRAQQLCRRLPDRPD